MFTPSDSQSQNPESEKDQGGWTFLINALGLDNTKARQASDDSPIIKSAEHTIEKPEINKQVEVALKSNPYIESSFIKVLSQGSRIILTGKVRSWFQKEEAGKVAKQASGNLNVINDIAISYHS
jgi:osmotically-inducible protein OsmY